MSPHSNWVRFSSAWTTVSNCIVENQTTHIHDADTWRTPSVCAQTAANDTWPRPVQISADRQTLSHAVLPHVTPETDRYRRPDDTREYAKVSRVNYIYRPIWSLPTQSACHHSREVPSNEQLTHLSHTGSKTNNRIVCTLINYCSPFVRCMKRGCISCFLLCDYK